MTPDSRVATFLILFLRTLSTISLVILSIIQQRKKDKKNDFKKILVEIT